METLKWNQRANPMMTTWKPIKTRIFLRQLTSASSQCTLYQQATSQNSQYRCSRTLVVQVLWGNKHTATLRAHQPLLTCDQITSSSHQATKACPLSNSSFSSETKTNYLLVNSNRNSTTLPNHQWTWGAKIQLIKDLRLAELKGSFIPMKKWGGSWRGTLKRQLKILLS